MGRKRTGAGPVSRTRLWINVMNSRTVTQIGGGRKALPGVTA